MFVSVDATAACDIALTLWSVSGRQSVTARRARVRRLLFRGGDYYGPIVNLAARLADQAVPRELLVTPEVAAQVTERLSFEPAGKRMLKGFDEPAVVITVLRARYDLGAGRWPADSVFSVLRAGVRAPRRCFRSAASRTPCTTPRSKAATMGMVRLSSRSGGSSHPAVSPIAADASRISSDAAVPTMSRLLRWRPSRRRARAALDAAVVRDAVPAEPNTDDGGEQVGDRQRIDRDQGGQLRHGEDRQQYGDRKRGHRLAHLLLGAGRCNFTHAARRATVSG